MEKVVCPKCGEYEVLPMQQCGYCGHQMPISEQIAAENGYLIRITTAPEAYDGFGTLTLEMLDTVTRYAGSERQYRKIAVRPEHAEWQQQRYSSGLYVCLTPEKFAEWKTDGYL